MLKGVASVEPGYSGGTVPNPTYEQVSMGDTGHAEVIRIVFNPDVISYKDLLSVFFATHDPTTLNRQGNDVGTQYRSAIFASSDEQLDSARSYIDELQAEEGGDPIVTEVVKLGEFYEAEDYHKNYYARNGGEPYCQVVISPKVAKAKKRFTELLKDSES